MRLLQEQTLSLEQVIEQIAELDREVQTLTRDTLVKKFKTAAIISNMEVPHGEKSAAMRRISVQTGIHINQLYEWIRIYDYFLGQFSRFQDWLNNTDRPTEQKLRDLISADKDPEVIGRERFKERTIKRVERIASDLDYLNSQDLEPDERTGIFTTALETLHEFQARGFDVIDREIKRFPVDKAYERKVSELPCCVSLSPAPSDPHHVEQGGVAMKGSSYSCIPLTRELHMELEEIGHESFEKKYNVKIGELVSRTMHKILFGSDLKFHHYREVN